jgi:hypothetical protein
MRKAALVIGIVFALWFILLVRAAVLADFEYGRQIQSYWDLSVKASTLQQKSTYLDQYVKALESTSLADYDAIWLKTPNNNIQQNLIALKSLQNRMHEIFGMDTNSFQYQQAIQQITAQEQDDAKEMLGVFEGAWYLNHHHFLWGWIGIGTGLLLLFGSIFFICAFFFMDDY